MTAGEWLVVFVLCALSLSVGLRFTRKAGRGGASGFFTGNRSLPWWAIGLSNTATYSSGGGAFVMLVLVFGLVGNWFWWGAWIVWMPLVAIVWARMWRRMQIVTTAELITLRYGGRPARLARKVYAFLLFSISILIIGYITGFFAKTIKPLVPLSEAQILLLFGGITAVYTVFGGLIGVVYTDIMQFCIFLAGNLVFFLLAVPQHGGWAAILARAAAARPGVLRQLPPTSQIPLLTLAMLIVQGLFFAGSPTAGEGMTAQRFMAARSEKQAMAGQLFNSFLSLSLRTIPLIGLGIIAFSLFWTKDLLVQVGPAPAGMPVLADPAYAWGTLIKMTRLPPGFTGVLIASELAAFMSGLSSMINWGSSLLVNDFYRSLRPNDPPRVQITVSRLTTLGLFVFAALVSILWVKGMVSWFLFINSVMVVFLLPLSWLRFFWWRFNVWGELSALVLGLPLSVLFWFILDFQNKPFWQSTGLLFVLSFIVLVGVTLLTPPESQETLVAFYRRCRPPGRWAGIREAAAVPDTGEPSTGRLAADSVIGVLASLGLVLATNAAFVGDWLRFGLGLGLAAIFSFWLMRRVLV